MLHSFCYEMMNRFEIVLVRWVFLLNAPSPTSPIAQLLHDTLYLHFCFTFLFLFLELIELPEDESPLVHSFADCRLSTPFARPNYRQTVIFAVWHLRSFPVLLFIFRIAQLLSLFSSIYLNGYSMIQLVNKETTSAVFFSLATKRL